MAYEAQPAVGKERPARPHGSHPLAASEADMASLLMFAVEAIPRCYKRSPSSVTHEAQSGFYGKATEHHYRICV